FTPSAARVMNLIATDVGRPISDIKPRINVPDLEKMITDVIETFSSKEREVQDQDGNWYDLSIRPYRTQENKIDGAVLAVFDIDALKRKEQQIMEAEALIRTILDTAAEGFITIDENGVIRSFNKAAEKMFGYNATEVIGKNVNMLMPTP